MEYIIIGDKVDHAIFAKTKEDFYRRFKFMVNYLPVGSYVVSEKGANRVEKPWFRYDKTPDGSAWQDKVVSCGLTRRKLLNVAEGLF